MTPLEPRVSVVVPVYNPGPYIEPAIASILGQTMAAGEVEAIFVDDGSTDGTAARLDRLAAEYPDTVRVLHIAPSGSPGRPRNVGIELARGEYIQFLDADDELALDALERLVAMADRNGSDVVVGKFMSASVPRSQRLLKRDVDRSSLGEPPWLVDSSLGPMKLFRRPFLREQGIAFPEGWRYMEDQHLVLQAYLRAGVISVLAGQPCYRFHLRRDGTNLTSQPIDPERHFGNLRTVIEMVEAESEAGPGRDRILRRLLRIEIMAKLGDRSYPDLTDDVRARTFTAARDLVQDRIDPRIDATLGPIGRIRCELLRADRPAEILALARNLRDLDLEASLDTGGWRRGRFEVAATAGLVLRSAGRSLVVVERGQRSFLDPAIADGLVGRSIDVSNDIGRLNPGIILRDRVSTLEWDLTAPPTASLPPEAATRRDRTTSDASEVPVRVTAKAAIDPEHVGTGALPVGTGTWEVLIRLDGLGIRRTAPLLTPRAERMQAAFRPILLGDPGRVVVPIVDATGLRLEVDPPAAVLADARAGRPVRVVRDGDRLVMELAILAGPGAAPLPVELLIRAPEGDRILAARLRSRYRGIVLEARVTGVEDLVIGQCPILLRLGGAGDGAEVALGRASMVGGSRLRILDIERLTTAQRIGAAVRWRASRGARRVILRGRSVYRRLPIRVRRPLRAIARRSR